MQDEWVTNNAKKHNLRGVGIPIKKLRSLRKKTHLPAVEPPHPGMSYNPSFEDHQDLLKIVAEKEVKLIKEEEHLIRCTKNMFQKVTPDSRDVSCTFFNAVLLYLLHFLFMEILFAAILVGGNV